MLLLFNAPAVFTNVPDIAKIYEINDKQIDEVENAATQLDKDIFFETMGEERIVRWEKILGITPPDNYSLEDRRIKVHLKVLEKVPYSYRILTSKLDTILGQGTYTLTINNNVLGFTCSVLEQDTFNNVIEMLEDIVPLNMYILVTNNLYRDIGTDLYIHTATVKTVERTISTE